MDQRASAALGGGAAAIVIAVLALRRAPAPQDPCPAAPVQARRPDSQDSVNAEIRTLKASVARLESELRELRNSIEEGKLSSEDSERPGKGTRSSARKETAAANQTGDEELFRYGGTHHGPRAVAALLGLDEDRRGALLEAYRRTLTRIRGLEAERARITLRGDTTQITIPPFPAEGNAIIAEWSRTVDALLTSSEKEQYRKLELGFFPRDLGESERSIAITRSGDSTSVTEVILHTDGRQRQSQTLWGPEEFALRPYRHLIPK